MAPQKSGSVRHRGRPTAPRLTPFRDDTGLVALRYEQTKQAEPPILLPPPRNPRRLTRPPSTLTSSTGPTSPIVVSPPAVPIPPPQEEHPLFRNQRPPSRRSQAEEWKRDSGAPTSSSATLREEYIGDPFNHKLLDDIADTPSVYSDDEEEKIGGPPPTSDHHVAPTQLTTLSIPSRAERIRENIVESPTHASSKSTSPARRTSFTEKLSRSWGIGPSGSKKLRKMMLGTDRAAAQAAPPETAPQQAGPGVVPGPSSVNREHAETDPLSSDSSPSEANKSFAPINTPIPDDSLWDDLGAVSFSKRGSIMFGGKNTLFKSRMMPSADAKAEASAPAPAPSEDQHATPTTPHNVATPQVDHARKADTTDGAGETDAAAEKPRAAPPQADASFVPSIRVSSMDVERESQKVRSLYESGDDLNWEDGGRLSFAERLEPTAEVPSEEEENVVYGFPCVAPGCIYRLVPTLTLSALL